MTNRVGIVHLAVFLKDTGLYEIRAPPHPSTPTAVESVYDMRGVAVSFP